MKLLGALFWLCIAAAIMGFTKVAAWLFLALIIVLFVCAPFAVLLGIIFGVSVGGGKDCES